MRTFFFILLVFTFSASFAQKDRDYIVLNTLLKGYHKRKIDKSAFLTYLNPNTQSLESESPQERIEEYSSSMNELIQKNMPGCELKITKKMLRKSFVKWDKQKIELSNFTDIEPEDPFYYYTKPIFINTNHFIITSYYIMPAGGISIILFKIDETSKEIQKIDGETLLLYGLNFR